MGNTLGRYVLREVVTAWLLVTGVLLVILLVNQMVGVLERAAASQYPEGVVLELIGLGALQNLSILLPVGLLLGVVLAFGRLYHDSEMAAALACGAGPANIYLPVALLAALGTAGLPGSRWCWRRTLRRARSTCAAPRCAPVSSRRSRPVNSATSAAAMRSCTRRTSIPTARSPRCSWSAIAMRWSRWRSRPAPGTS